MARPPVPDCQTRLTCTLMAILTLALMCMQVLQHYLNSSRGNLGLPPLAHGVDHLLDRRGHVAAPTAKKPAAGVAGLVKSASSAL